MKEELDLYLEDLVKKEVFPGCNYCLITNSGTFYGSIGYKSLVPKKVKNNINNLYDVASITKLLVTNTLISFLIRDNKLKLDDYVKDYLPNFKYEDIKIIHLLTHSSGIKPLFDKYHLQSKDEFMINIERMFDAGSNVKYIDTNFILLGFIIEKIYQESLDVLADKLIFKPLKMHNTSFNPKNIKKCVPNEVTKERGLVCGFVHDEKAYFLNGVAGHAGVFSTVLDLSHFLEMILNDGYYEGKQFLDLTYIDLWFTPLFISDEGIRRTIGWVYGKSSFLCNKVCSDDTIIHTGFPGHHILIDRGNDIAFLLCSNRIHPTRDNTKLLELREDINEKLYQLLKKYKEIY